MNVGLYPRVSTQEQALNGHSIDEQIDRMAKYCEAKDWQIFKIYTDAGYSGGNTDRPGLQALIRDVKAGKLDKVLVYKLDRLSRSQKDTLVLIEDIFLANNTDFVSMNENFDTSTPFGRAMIGILAVFAQLEREQIKERMQMGLAARAKEGLFRGAKPPVGYDYTNGRLVVNEFERVQIQTIFDMLTKQNASVYAISTHLNAAGMIPHDWKRWTPTNVRLALSRKTYLGLLPYKNDWIPGIHEPIISEEQFNLAQQILADRSKDHQIRNRRFGNTNSLLGGIVYCGICGAKLVKKAVNNYAYYGCVSVMNHRAYTFKDASCTAKYIRMETLDQIVINQINRLQIDPDYIKQIKADNRNDQAIASIQKQIKLLDDQIDKLMDLYTDGTISVEIIQDRIGRIAAQKKSLSTECERLKEENNQRLSEAESLELAKSFADVFEHGTADDQRGIVRALIDKVIATRSDQTIVWKF